MGLGGAPRNPVDPVGLPSPAVLLVGLTGGIGSGKSTVAAMLAERGAVIIDADAIVMEVRKPGGEAYEGIVERFGTGIVGGDGRLDRQALAAVGNDEAIQAELRALTYPHMDKVIADRIALERDTHHIVVLAVIPRFGQRGPDRYGLSAVIVVDVPVEEAVRRLIAYRGFTEEQARARIATQMSREARRAVADVVIDNSGSVDDVAGQVETLWDWLLALRDRAKSI